jgi:hypothetical protein
MGEQIGQRRSEEERREYIVNTNKTTKKNETITKLLHNFPTPNSIK